MKAFVSWSGGKDAALAFYKASQIQGVEISCLMNMISEDGKHSRTHGVSAGLLRLQADSMGVPIIQRKTTWKTYEEKFKKTVLSLKRKGIQAGVFGDIDLQNHRDWVERVCGEINIKPIFPLWQRGRDEILQEFIYSGFEAVVVAAKMDVLAASWLGRRVNAEFIKEMKKISGVDLCGEAGEYHTFVFDGPIFKKKIRILETEKIKRDENWFLNILNYETSD